MKIIVKHPSIEFVADYGDEPKDLDILRAVRAVMPNKLISVKVGKKEVLVPLSMLIF
jgi:hypothetical protein